MLYMGWGVSMRVCARTSTHARHQRRVTARMKLRRVVNASGMHIVGYIVPVRRCTR